MSRAVVTVATTNEQIKLPAVFTAPIRLDVVHAVHRDIAKNRRQARAVSDKAGHQHSAESWGTGRAVSRIPRVSGGGTHRAGQAAFGNMCRKGRMFAPTKTWRKWHRKVNTNLRRYAVVSSVAASAVPSLVFARGHRINEVEEVPCVVPSAVESIQKTKDAVALLKKVGAYVDVERSLDSISLRCGKGKLRNRRYVKRRGPLLVYAEDKGIVRAFRNLPGVDLCHVNKLNILQLAPGGHLGRFVIWTKDAFKSLDNVFGTQTKFSKEKSGYKLPRSVAINADLSRLINSEQIQAVIRGNKKNINLVQPKRNPLKNITALRQINAYGAMSKKAARKELEARKANREQNMVQKRRNLVAKAKANKDTKKAFYKSFLAPIVEAKPVAAAAPKSPVVEEKKDVAKKPEKKTKAPAPEEEDDSLF